VPALDGLRLSVGQLAARPKHTGGIDSGSRRGDDPIMADDLDPREAERIRRRDHEAAARERELLRPGMGKVFKQIQDAQLKAATEPPKRRRRKPA